MTTLTLWTRQAYSGLFYCCIYPKGRYSGLAIYRHYPTGLYSGQMAKTSYGEIRCVERIKWLLYSIVLYLYIYIALHAVHTNQKRFQCKRPREKRAVLREPKRQLAPHQLVTWIALKEGVGYIIQNLYKSRIIQGKLILTFRMFIYELCHDGGHIVERWCLCQDARLQVTKHCYITNQTSLFTYQSEWKEQLEATDMLCVQRSTRSPKEWIRRPKTKTCQCMLKLFTGANPVKCFCALLLAMKTV